MYRIFLRTIADYYRVTFTISAVHLLRKACVNDTKIRKWALKYRSFAYMDETLTTLSWGDRSIGTHLRTTPTTIMKASVILVNIISMHIDKLENRIEKRADSHDWPHKLRRFLVICLYWTIFLGCIISFIFVFLGLALFLPKVDMKTWSFGQIVAMTVWAPPLCEYFYLEWRKCLHLICHRKSYRCLGPEKLTFSSSQMA